MASLLRRLAAAPRRALASATARLKSSFSDSGGGASLFFSGYNNSHNSRLCHTRKLHCLFQRANATRTTTTTTTTCTTPSFYAAAVGTRMPEALCASSLYKMAPWISRLAHTSVHESPSEADTDDWHTLSLTRGESKRLHRQRELFNKIGRKLHIKEMEDWYHITRKQVAELGGEDLLNGCNGSLEIALKRVYPYFHWQPSKFLEKRIIGRNSATTSEHPHQKSSYSSPYHTKLFNAVIRAEEKLGIKSAEDWYSVTSLDLKQLGFPRTLTREKLAQLLSEVYPDYDWAPSLLLQDKCLKQKQLESVVSELFPDKEIVSNYHDNNGTSKLYHREAEEHVDIDVLVPDLALAFVYEERHKPPAIRTWTGCYEIADDDAHHHKQQLAEALGITLISVPCWWDGEKDSLQATIKQARPDLLTEVEPKAQPIPDESPPHFIETHMPGFIEDIGNPITSCFYVQTQTDPTDMWMFEKYDGLRAFWNPLKKIFYSRYGNPLPVPHAIIDTMPTHTFLDGEIWFGRSNLQEAMKVANRVDVSEIDWTNFQYMVFDLPNHQGSYEERYYHLVDLFSQQEFPFCTLAPKVVCKSTQHLDTYFQDIVENGGEGVILRDPSSLYQPGRSAGFLKHKKFRDAEARVIAQVAPNSWECELPNGVRFKASPLKSDFLKHPVKEGDIVSYVHRGFMAGTKKPKMPMLHRLRQDMSWEQVVQHWKEKKAKVCAWPSTRQHTCVEHYPKKYWRDGNHRREFFIDFAKKAGFDPFVPENWARVTSDQIIDNKGKKLLSVYSGSLKLALQHTFPELTFTWPANGSRWKDTQNCREFFDEWAREKGYDPLDPETWYTVNIKDILLEPQGRAIHFHNGGLKKALQSAYPELQFTKWPFSSCLLG